MISGKTIFYAAFLASWAAAAIYRHEWAGYIDWPSSINLFADKPRYRTFDATVESSGQQIHLRKSVRCSWRYDGEISNMFHKTYAVTQEALTFPLANGEGGFIVFPEACRFNVAMMRQVTPLIGWIDSTASPGIMKIFADGGADSNAPFRLRSFEIEEGGTPSGHAPDEFGIWDNSASTGHPHYSGANFVGLVGVQFIMPHLKELAGHQPFDNASGSALLRNGSADEILNGVNPDHLMQLEEKIHGFIYPREAKQPSPDLDMGRLVSLERQGDQPMWSETITLYCGTIDLHQDDCMSENFQTQEKNRHSIARELQTRLAKEISSDVPDLDLLRGGILVNTKTATATKFLPLFIRFQRYQ